jgi:hypothetical protein
MQIKLHRYWFSFENLPSHSALILGCGVSAYTYEDAVNILKETIFAKYPDAAICDATIDVDVRSLDAGVVQPNMGDVTVRGVWFPIGYN